MKSVGNGLAQNCVQNILTITRGEAPYLRGMGLDGSLYDKPSEVAKPLILSDAEEQIENYEERAQVNNIEISDNADDNAAAVRFYTLKPDITVIQ